AVVGRRPAGRRRPPWSAPDASRASLLRGIGRRGRRFGGVPAGRMYEPAGGL
ncbi:MAG: hypothetical protein AVDCRST_MAG69-282, partial [uncultured Solirubrobacteraceae bacterium]